jgi:putative FmdB family regulatory protein
MPIYAYRCERCGHAKDVLQKVSDPVLTVCPACGEPTFRKQVTAAGFQLKGSGWYVTDFRGDKPSGKSAEADGDAKTGDAKNADAKNDAKGSDAKTGDAGADAVGKAAGSAEGAKVSKSDAPAAAPPAAKPAAAPPSTGGSSGGGGQP